MNTVFWAGAFVGAVFGVLADFFARPLQRFLDRRIQDRTTVRSRLLVSRLKADRQAVRDFLLLQVLETTYIGALVGILAGVLFAASTSSYAIVDGPNWVGTALSVTGQALTLVAGVLIVRIAGDAIRVVRAVLPDSADVGRDEPPVPRPSRQRRRR
jgi:hypothetical protein